VAFVERVFDFRKELCPRGHLLICSFIEYDFDVEREMMQVNYYWN
jgi:hypothetical protein